MPGVPRNAAKGNSVRTGTRKLRLCRVLGYFESRPDRP